MRIRPLLTIMIIIIIIINLIRRTVIAIRIMNRVLRIDIHNRATVNRISMRVLVAVSLALVYASQRTF